MNKFRVQCGSLDLWVETKSGHKEALKKALKGKSLKTLGVLARVRKHNAKGGDRQWLYIQP